MITINWEELNKPKAVNKLIDGLMYSNYQANRDRGMSHESLVRGLELSAETADYYAERYKA